MSSASSFAEKMFSSLILRLHAASLAMTAAVIYDLLDDIDTLPVATLQTELPTYTTTLANLTANLEHQQGLVAQYTARVARLSEALTDSDDDYEETVDGLAGDDMVAAQEQLAQHELNVADIGNALRLVRRVIDAINERVAVTQQGSQRALLGAANGAANGHTRGESHAAPTARCRSPGAGAALRGDRTTGQPGVLLKNSARARSCGLRTACTQCGAGGSSASMTVGSAAAVKHARHAKEPLPTIITIMHRFCIS